MPSSDPILHTSQCRFLHASCSNRVFFSLSPLHALSSHSRFHLTYAVPHILCRTSMLAFLFSTLLTLVHILLYTLDTPHLMLNSKAGPFCHLFSSCHSVFPLSTLHYVQPYSVQHAIRDFVLFMPQSLPMPPSACSTLHSSCSIRNVLCWAASTISALNPAPHFLQSSFPPHLPFSSPCFFPLSVLSLPILFPYSKQLLYNPFSLYNIVFIMFPLSHSPFPSLFTWFSSSIPHFSHSKPQSPSAMLAPLCVPFSWLRAPCFTVHGRFSTAHTAVTKFSLTFCTLLYTTLCAYIVYRILPTPFSAPQAHT